MRKVREVINDHQVVLVIESEEINADSLPGSGSWWQWYERLFCMSLIIVLAIRTVDYHLLDIIRYPGPIYQISSSAQRSLYANMTRV